MKIDPVTVHTITGLVELRSAEEGRSDIIVISFEAIEQIYDSIKPHLKHRRELGLKDGEFNFKDEEVRAIRAVLDREQG